MSDADTMGISGDELAALEQAVLRGLQNARINREHEQQRELFLNQLADRVARLSRAAGSPINAYHARADIDAWLAQGKTVAELPALYAKHYGIDPRD